MKMGTRSLLFGVHQFLIHPLLVWRAWVKLYGRPSWRELFAIWVHDLGYWGCAEMNGPEGSQHSVKSAEIAVGIFRKFYPRAHAICWVWSYVAYHSRHHSASVEAKPSKLCWPDKLATCYYPTWLYLMLAKATGEWKEYRDADIAKHPDHASMTDAQLLNSFKDHAKAMVEAETGVRL